MGLDRANSGADRGVASVIDGDTIEVHGQRVRFNAVDAPKS
ncbi:MAG: thermonuclease family protein, partial [Mesorhizobium sp.]